MRKIATDHPELGLNADELIAKLGKPVAAPPASEPPAEEEPSEPRPPLGRNPYDYDALHPAYKRPGVHPFGDWTTN